MAMIGIYRITSPSGKMYIGQTWDHVKRFSKYRLNDTERQPKVRTSFNKYGPKAHNIEMIHELPKDVSQKVMDDYEIFYIAQYKSVGIDLMNMNEGGSGCKPSDETRLKMSLRQKGVPLHIRIGVEAANRQKERMSKAKKGVPHSKEHRQNMKGKPVSAEKRLKISNGLKKYYKSIQDNN